MELSRWVELLPREKMQEILRIFPNTEWQPLTLIQLKELCILVAYEGYMQALVPADIKTMLKVLYALEQCGAIETRETEDKIFEVRLKYNG